jgi:ATP-dependent helicase/nuclease subunit A
VDEFLIITYTNAAAAELRGKILDSITEKIAQEPANRRLRRQKELCYRASIALYTVSAPQY